MNEEALAVIGFSLVPSDHGEEPDDGGHNPTQDDDDDGADGRDKDVVSKRVGDGDEAVQRDPDEAERRRAAEPEEEVEHDEASVEASMRERLAGEDGEGYAEEPDQEIGDGQGHDEVVGNRMKTGVAGVDVEDESVADHGEDGDEDFARDVGYVFHFFMMTNIFQIMKCVQLVQINCHCCVLQQAHHNIHNVCYIVPCSKNTILLEEIISFLSTRRDLNR